jgi:lipoprotein-releasing system ATP-binding protein
VLVVNNLSKEYLSPAGPLRILDAISFSLQKGDAAAIMGPSGSGKSTLLQIIGGLDTPTAGSVTLAGADPFSGSERTRAAFRNEHVGFVFQDHALLPQCTVLENVMVPLLVAPRPARSEHRARELLEMVGLTQRLHHRPGELSGGEKQRVAIARALIRNPSLLLCDEPTGNLDHASALSVARLLLEVHQRQDAILVIVTHSEEIAGLLPRCYQLRDGTLVDARA